MGSRVLPVIPPVLEAYSDNIRRSIKNALNLKLRPAPELTPWQSKVGGTPYMPVTADHPRSSDGDPLKLLARINFAEAPHLPGYPEKGILQFFIHPADEFYGSEQFESVHDGQTRFRLIYHNTIEEHISKLRAELPYRIENYKVIESENGKQSDFNFPLGPSAQFSIEFEPFQQYLTYDDYRTGVDIFGCNADLPLSDQYATSPELFDHYEEHFKGSGHLIGGYPCFTQQDDPRGTKPELRGYELLLQLDTEYFGSDGVVWGDDGVANFFIHPVDLEKQNFSKAIYTWDCW